MSKQHQLPTWIKQQLPEFLESNFTETSKGRIHYLCGGSGNPIVFIHGNPTWSFLWRKVIAELNPTQNSFYAPDLLNLGYSGALKNKDFNLRNHSQAIKEFIEKLDLKNITLVVQDWGGPIGLHAASQVSNRISKLVVLNTGISAPEPPYKISKFHSFVNRPVLPDIAFRVFGMPMYSLHKVQADRNSIKGDVAKAYRHPIRAFKRWNSALQFARMVPNNDRHPSFQYFKEIEDYCTSFDGPIEVVWGIKDPILGRYIKKVRKLLPNANFTEVNAGHFLQEECAREIAQKC